MSNSTGLSLASTNAGLYCSKVPSPLPKNMPSRLMLSMNGSSLYVLPDVSKATMSIIPSWFMSQAESEGRSATLMFMPSLK